MKHWREWITSAILDVAKISRDSTRIARRLKADSEFLTSLAKLIESVQLSLARRRPDDDTSSVIHFIHTEGVLELLHAQCEELTKSLQDQQAMIESHRTEIGSESHFRQRFFAAWSWRKSLVPRMNELQLQLEGLKASVKMSMQLVQLES